MSRLAARAALSAALAGCIVGEGGCTRYPDAARTPAFALNLQLTPAAEQRLHERHAKLGVYVDTYGIANEHGAGHADEMDRVMLIPEQTAVATRSGTIRFEGRTYPRHLVSELQDGQIRMDIGAGYYDRELNRKVLDCDTVTGGMTEVLAKGPVVRCDVFKS